FAADPRNSRELIAGLEETSAAVTQLKARASRRRNAPPFAIVRLWLSDVVHSDRPAFLGTRGSPLLAHLSVLAPFEATAAQWTRTHGGSVVELHAYAVDGPADPDSAHGKTVRDALLGDMYLVYPESRGMTIVAEEYLLDDDCGLADISPWDDHPEVIT